MSDGIQIDRVKYFEKDGKIDIAYKKKEDTSDAVFIASFREQASPEFYEALQNLAPSVCQILELPVSVENKLIPYGVSFKYANDGAMSAVISAKLKLPAKDTCVSINTPRMKCPQDEVDAQESGIDQRLRTGALDRRKRSTEVSSRRPGSNEIVRR